MGETLHKKREQGVFHIELFLKAWALQVTR